MKKVAVVILVFIFLFAGCTKNKSQESNTVIDSYGREVVIPNPITGVITRATTASFMAAFGKADLVKGTYKYVSNNIWADYLYPELGSAKNFTGNPTAESFYELNVNFCIWEDQKTTETLREKGIGAFGLHYDDLKNNVKTLSAIFGTADWTERWIAYYDKTLNLISERTQTISSKSSVYYVHGAGNSGILHTAAGGTVSEKWIVDSGAYYGLHDTKGYGIDITKEELLKLNPDVIVIGGVYYESMLNTFYTDLTLENMDAVKTKKIYNVPVGIIPWDQYGVEYPLLCLWTAKTVYPEHFSDIDIYKETKNFYKEYCGLSLTEKDIKYMLAGKGPHGESLIKL